MTANVIEALAVFLKADAGVAALAGTRVFGSELPRAEAKSMPRQCVVLQPSGGAAGRRGYMRHAPQRVDARCYGATPYEAEELRGAVAMALTQLKRATVTTDAGDVLVHWVEDAGGYLAGRDPDGDWPLAFQSFQAFYAESVIAA